MKAGDEWNCPLCGKNSFLKKESLMEGWIKKGEVLKCAACGAVAEEITENTAAVPENMVKSNALSALLGETLEKTVNPLESVERRFCRDCKFRVMNAFRIYCTKHDKDVNPMDDCPDYEKRPLQS